MLMFMSRFMKNVQQEETNLSEAELLTPLLG